MSPDWFIYSAEAPADAEVRLSEEHDRYAWCPLDRATAPVLPERVRACLIAAAQQIDVGGRKAAVEL